MQVLVTNTSDWYRKGEVHEVNFKATYGYYYLLRDHRKKIYEEDCIRLVSVPSGSFECPKPPEVNFALETNNVLVKIAYHNLTHPK